MNSILWIQYAWIVILLSAVTRGYPDDEDGDRRNYLLRYLRDIRDNEVPDEDELSIRMTEICSNDGDEMKCSPNESLKIGNIVCGGGSHSCPSGTNRTVFAVCHGQRTCATLGLRNMFDSYCGSPMDITRQIHVTYRCIASATSWSSCKSNICETTNKGLQCHNNGVIHITRARCLDGVSPCSWPTFVSLYTLCEGQDSCAASGLRMMMPSYCNHQIRSQRNVHVDYICLPSHTIENKCTGRVKELGGHFGVMMNPGYTSGTGPGSSSEQCYWHIKHDPQTTINVTVHLAYRKKGMPNCNTQFLQVRYTECQMLSSRISSYCDLKKVNQKFSSCGDVYITSFLPPSIEDLSDRFLVSYKVINNTNINDVIQVDDVTKCGADLPVLASSTIAVKGSHKSGRNYGPHDTLFDYADDQSKHGETTEKDSTSTPSGIALKFKLVILYVFFGIVILALLIALIFVIVSYRGIAKKGQYKVESSEKMALWKNEDNTHAESAQHNSIAENSNPSELNTPGSQSDEPKRTVATVHSLSPEEDPNRLSVATGRFSSFRDSEEYNDGMNQYASFTSLNSDDIPVRSNRALNEKTKRGGDQVPEEQPLVLQNGIPGMPNGVEHYTINDDDYAIVRKSKKPANNIKETNVDDVEPSYDNLFDEELIGFKPTSGPYDKNRDSGMDFNIRFSSINGWNDEL